MYYVCDQGCSMPRVSNIPEKSRGARSADLEGSETSTLVVLSHVNIAVTPLASPFIAT